MREIRLLTKDEIECRVAQVDKNLKWCSLLLYKDARVDMRILDETFGSMNWQRHHEIVDGNLYCTVDIWDDAKKQWVSKQDVGVESMTEKEKGQASDAFKRACFNVGIGRELYTAPTIFINLGQEDLNNLNKVKTRFQVSKIDYSGGSISDLEIVDDKGRVRYSYKPVNTVNVLDSIAKANTVEDLTKIFNANKGLQADQSFITALTNRKKQLAV